MAPRKRRPGGGNGNGDGGAGAGVGNAAAAAGNNISSNNNRSQFSNSNDGNCTQNMSASSSNGKRNNNNRRNTEEVHLIEAERFPLQSKVADFVSSGEDELILENLSNVHRKYLHKYVARLGLKSRSHGDKKNRVLVISRRKRLVQLGNEHKMNLPSSSRKMLIDMLPTLRQHLESTKGLLKGPANIQKNIRLRGEALLMGLGPRMVPPRANRISNELYRDKQELPIFCFQDELMQMLRTHPVIIVNGETGSGKTTQVPQYILNDAARRNRPCRIICTQPRRVAAVSVAHRVAEERGEQVGETVGYQIRMESRLRKTTNLIYSTSGCLLRAIMADCQDLFRKISHLIIDEIHERDKNTDFTLITVKEQLQKHKDMRVVLMSATMDIGLLSKYFDNCPILNVPGQGFDVKIYHLEDILFHSGYRTALMKKYLRSMGEMEPQQVMSVFNSVGDSFNTVPIRLNDEYLQEMLDAILNRFCEAVEEQLHEEFDQIQYYVESEGMPVDAGHSLSGLTPLMAACKCNYPKYVHLFLQHHANINIHDVQGYTAMDYAMLHADKICVQMLQDYGGVALQQQQHLQHQMTQEEAEKQRLLIAYQQQVSDENEVDHDLILSMLEGIYRNSHPGAIMVFLPGYNDILQQSDLIQSTFPAGTYRICILHGQMDSQDQFEALKRHNVRKIILSTNIGQTSITIPDLAYIIDSGKVKMKTYDSITESSQLSSVWISKADAKQRSGRAGRTQNGVCYRLYSRAKFDFMPTYSIPEFMRIPLTEICLYAKTLDAQTSVQSYLSRALNPPSSISIAAAVRKLQTLQVFNDDESVTELGRHLVDMPLDVQLGKCLLYSIFLRCVDPILTIVAYHSVKDPYVLPHDRAAQGQASFQRKSFAGNSFSDQMGILALYKAYYAVRNNRQRARSFCSKYFLSQSAMEMFFATRRQIADLISQKFRIGQQATIFNDEWVMVRFCLVAGFYPNVAVVDRNKRVLISGAEKQLILQRTSAVNPPGKRNLKDFVDQLPHDWIVFYEKSRISNMCSISMNTVIHPVLVALQCGRDVEIIEDDDENWDVDSGQSDDEDCDEGLAKEMNCLNVDDQRNAIMTLDKWISFDISVSDANMLLMLRTLLQMQFEVFLQYGQIAQTSTASFALQKFLYSLGSQMPGPNYITTPVGAEGRCSYGFNKSGFYDRGGSRGGNNGSGSGRTAEPNDFA